jgi:hypothetical protein
MCQSHSAEESNNKNKKQHDGDLFKRQLLSPKQKCTYKVMVQKTGSLEYLEDKNNFSTTFSSRISIKAKTRAHHFSHRSQIIQRVLNICLR